MRFRYSFVVLLKCKEKKNSQNLNEILQKLYRTDVSFFFCHHINQSDLRKFVFPEYPKKKILNKFSNTKSFVVYKIVIRFHAEKCTQLWLIKIDKRLYWICINNERFEMLVF